MKNYRITNFTLVELLTVISIITVLAALLFPSLSKVKGKAQAISCIGNLRQVGTSLMIYTQDYKGILPKLYDTTSSTGWTTLLMNTGYLKKYAVGEKTVLTCSSLRPQGIYEKWYWTYGLRQADTNLDISTGIITLKADILTSPALIARVSPSMAAILGDTIDGTTLSNQFYKFNSHTSSAAADLLHFRHNGTANLFFADGHASGNKEDICAKIFIKYYKTQDGTRKDSGIPASP